MENCLVTKLKASVNNDSLEYLGKVVLTVQFKDGYPVEGDNLFVFGPAENISSNDITSLDDATFELKSNGYGRYYFFVKKGVSNSARFLLPKYAATSAGIFSLNTVSINAECILKMTNIISLELGNNDNGATTTMLKNNSILEELEVGNYGLSGNLSELSNCTSLRTINFVYTREVTGDLSAIKDLPNLQNVTMNNVVITDELNTVEYLQDRGVTVTYIPYT